VCVAGGAGERPGDAGQVTGVDRERRYPNENLASLRSPRFVAFHNADYLRGFARPFVDDLARHC
jgi:hypothetical protein